MSTKNLIVIVGPTAVGKTGLAIKLAKFYKTEIISADSRQIYKELEIGTAKPSLEELLQVKHHFINTKSVMEEYDAGTFGKEAREVIDELFKTHGQVVMCGGSGLYIKSVLEGFDDLPDVPAEIRIKIVEEYGLKGLGWLQEEVAMQDPDYFDVVDKQNPQRLMRSLEIMRSTGKAFSGFHKKKKVELPFRVVKLGLELSRPESHGRIDQRMDNMIENGLFDEAEKLISVRHLNGLQTVGYLEAFGFFEGMYDREEAIRLMKRNSRRYAKRQLTWFRKDKEIRWVHPEDWNGILSHLKEKAVG